MEQLALFAEAGQSKALPNELLEYQPQLIDPKLSDQLLEKYIRQTPWKQTTQKLWDKEYLTPRLTCWYGDTERIAGTQPKRRNCKSGNLSSHWPVPGSTAYY